MPRVKKSEQKSALDRQRSALVAKLKEKNRKAKAIEREELEHRALIAGRALVAELEKNPESPEAAAIRTVLSNRLTKAADREALGLPPLLGKTAAKAPEAPPAPKAATVEAAPARERRPSFGEPPKVDPRHAVERVGPPSQKPAPVAPVEAAREPPAETPAPGLLGSIARVTGWRGRQT